MNSLGKSERLRRRKDIDTLFLSGNKLKCFPFKIVYDVQFVKNNYPLQFVATVPKRRFKKAVSRNLLRRKIKEAYRKNKNILDDLLQEGNIQIKFMFIYMSDEFLEYSKIEEKMISSLNKFKNKVITNKEECIDNN